MSEKNKMSEGTVEKWNETCPTCGKIKSYSERYDALYCASCDIWLDDSCDDPECGYCSQKPEKPSKAKNLDYTFEELMDGSVAD